MAWLDGWASPMLRMFGFAQISVVDVRSPEAYQQGHVPFAVNIPADVFRAHLHQSDDKLAALLGAAGVDAAHEAVIAADGGLTPASALAYWMLERLGQQKVSLLADSLDDWALGGLPVAKEPTVVGARRTPQDVAVPATTYPTDRVRTGTLLAPAGRPGETTPPAAYPKVYLAAGKQPPARVPAGVEAGKVIHLPYAELLDANGAPKAAKDLWSLLAKAGVPRYAEVVAFADDPGEAAVSYFVLKLMGFADVKLGGITTTAGREPHRSGTR
jgi:3-mercaptopyruvate sulfurtransferase SseA